ncbi:MAG: hypothetical protein JWP34_1472 [Massilia sp.]|nr:hypothetical protein [Massilia sp.]
MKPATLKTVVPAQAGTHAERAAPHRILSMGLRDDGPKGEGASEHFERETS